MYATVCKQNNNSDKDIANFITCDFTGILKCWWDHCITLEQNLKIFNVIKTKNNILTQDAVYTIIMTILEHFSGGVTDHGEKNRTLLQNLKFPTLTHFRWYKDTFLNRIMLLNDGNNIYWKLKLIDGSLNLFAERVRKTLRDKNNGTIPYHNYTYGNLINSCIQEGLALCNDLKLRHQLKVQRSLKESN